jgi:hypothetical protein
MGIETYLNWYISNSPLPATEEEMLMRDPRWDKFIRDIGTLISFQIEKMGGLD